MEKTEKSYKSELDDLQYRSRWDGALKGEAREHTLA
jgi:hypothetical protein